MKWRCEWCGKPQERNDPPCDDCGHHSFERAVVPKAPAESREEYVWVCPECGRSSPRNNPPCSRCGNMKLERRSTDYLDPGELGGTGWRDVLEWWHLVVVAVLLVVATVVALGVVGVVDLPGARDEPSDDGVPATADEVDGISLSPVESQFLTVLSDKRVADEQPRAVISTGTQDVRISMGAKDSPGVDVHAGPDGTVDVTPIPC